MPLIPLNLDLEKIEEIDSICEILNITRAEYAHWMFVFGKWMIEEAQKGRTVVSLDTQSRKYTKLHIPQLEWLRGAYRLLEVLKKK